MSKIVEWFTAEGAVVQYRPLSARLPAFLAVYGPERGYAVDTAMQDSLSLKPGLMKLYETVLQAGCKPEAVGLPPLSVAGQTLVCRATLRDPAGRILATATAAKVIQSYKDLEVLETAARQRLLAALGFGGDVFDRDEDQDRADQGGVCRSPVPSPTVVPVAKAVRAMPGGAPAFIPEAVDDPASIQDPVEAPASIRDIPASVAPPPVVAASPTSDRDTRALTALIRQIEQQARVRGIEPPVVTTRPEAQAALQRLLRRA